MSLVDWLLRRGRSLTPPQRERLAHWRALPEPDLREPQQRQRYVVVDVESTGLDLHSDRLIAIGAVAIEHSRVVLEQSLYRVLRQQRASDHGNILVHGIGGSAQTGGDDPIEVLLDFLEFIGKSPLVGFHAQFDEIMLRKATRACLGNGFRRTWIDLAHLAPGLHPSTPARPKSLDDWLADYGIVNYSRHDALADALATAQLFLVLQQRAGQAVAFFRAVYSRYQSEAVALLAWREAGRTYELVIPHQTVGGGHCDYEVRDFPAGLVRLGTIHSHAGIEAFHSERDDADERHEDGFHLTVGNIDGDLTLACSVVVQGYRGYLPPEDLFAPYPIPWTAAPREEDFAEVVNEKVIPLPRPIEFGP